ncbi:DUF4406 domain-containing protein [Actinomycetaceae bacterium WB03_NA08]|uniref:DUF4406 domain-containing protein n=2 Tax=Scrofimicrobium canadense TaxID=2652290 RepID=A0A6N7W8Q3_9ACTO|nr:DUF4406 domain-containing protein [Scrofimicrobium canadense]
MSGLPEYNYPAFHEAARELREAGYEVLNPAESNRPTSDPWQLFMRDAIGMLIQADGVALLPGWSKSRGACIEIKLAIDLGIEIATPSAWIKEEA